MPVERHEFAALSAAHAERLDLLARRLALSGQDPEDLLQDTMEKAWRSYESLRDHEAVGTWLRTIMVNQARDHARRANLFAFTPLQEIPDPEDLEIDDPVAIIVAAEEEQQLRSALRELPHEELIAVVLLDGEGWSASEIAAVCDCSAGAIYKRVQRGRARLALRLASTTGQRAPRATAAACHNARALASAYLDSRLEEEQRTEVERHLLTCERCPPVLRALQGIVAALGAGRGPALPANRLTELHAQIGTLTATRLCTVAVIGAGPGGLAAAKRLVQRAAGRINVVLVNPKATATHLASTAEVALGWVQPDFAEVPISLSGVRVRIGEAQIAHDLRLLVDGAPFPAAAVIAAPGLSLDFDAVPEDEPVVAAWDPQSARRAGELLRAAEIICLIVARVPYRCPPAPFGLATRLAARGQRVTVCTPEATPLLGVGPPAARLLQQACKDAGVRLASCFQADLSAGLHGRVRSLGGDEISFDAALVIPPHRRSSALQALPGDGPLVGCQPDGRVGERLWVVGDAREAPLPRAAGVAAAQGRNAADAVLAELGIVNAPPPALPEPSCWLWVDERRAARIGLRFPDGLPLKGHSIVQIDGPSAKLAAEAQRGVEELAAQASS
jgi:sulfide:quinone oxidoreductase